MVQCRPRINSQKKNGTTAGWGDTLSEGRLFFFFFTPKKCIIVPKWYILLSFERTAPVTAVVPGYSHC